MPAKQKRQIHSLLPRQMFSQFLESSTSACIVVVWEDKHHNHEHSLHSSFPLAFIAFIAEHKIMVWNIPLVIRGQLS